MNLTLYCDCSRQFDVHIASAGTRITCPCGRELKVPSLAQFRAQAGLSAIPLNSVQIITQKLRSGELPGSSCVGCERSPTAPLPLVAHCERSFTERQSLGTAGTVLNVIFATIMYAAMAIIMPVTMILRRESEESDRVLGRDVSTYVPLPLCDACQQARGRPFPVGSLFVLIISGLLLFIAWRILPRPAVLIGAAIYIVFGAGCAIVADLGQQRQRQWKSWLMLVPEYARMLQEFPTTQIELVQQRSPKTVDATADVT